MIDICKPRCAPAKAAVGRLQRFASAACGASGADGAGILVLAGNGDVLDHVLHGLAEEQAEELRRAPRFHEFLRNTMEQEECRDASRHIEADSLNAWSWLAVALPWLGGQRGVLYAVRAAEAPFTPQEIQAMRVLASLLEQESLTEESHLIAKLRLLNHLAQAAADQRDLHRLLNLAIKELDRHIPMQAVAIWLLADSEQPESLHSPPMSTASFEGLASTLVLEGVHERAAAFGLQRGARVDCHEVVFEECLGSGEAMYVDRGMLSATACPLAPGLLQGGANACFVVPLRAGKRIVGVLESICTRADGFTNEEIQLYYLVADLLGPAIAQAVLFQRLSAAYDELRNTQSQLIQNEKMRALGEMASGMAHDFNNALCGVLGFLDLALLDGNIAPTCRGYLEASKTCAQDAAHTVRRVQEFARRHRAQGTMQPLELDDLVRQIVELTRPKWESLHHVMEKPIAVNLATEARCRINGCASELREALTNLIFNAVDAMPQGGTLTVRTMAQHHQAVIMVQDTGTGIPEEVKRRLFEPFFTTKGDRGTGLGLSVTFGIIKRHFGEIDVESRAGYGARFTIRLPIFHDEAATPVSHVDALAKAQPGSRVLVVDDEESVRRYLSAGLQQLGYETELVPTAEDALSLLHTENFDVVLTDLGLPGMSGEELARTVHRRNPQTPVVLLTGWGDQIKAENRRFEGVTQVLSKPITLGALAQTLAAVFAA
jgi:signal transduction histidine kinase/CheY-like chemotaxis protein